MADSASDYVDGIVLGDKVQTFELESDFAEAVLTELDDRAMYLDRRSRVYVVSECKRCGGEGEISMRECKGCRGDGLVRDYGSRQEPLDDE